MNFEIPENIPGLTDEDLTAAIEAAYTAADVLIEVDDAEMTDEQVGHLNSIAEFLAAAKGEQGVRAEAAAARAEQIAAARAAVAREPEVEDEPEAVAEETVETEPVEVDQTEVTAPVAVAAAVTPAPRKRNAVARTAQATTKTPVSHALPTITASAEAMDLQPGQQIQTLNDLVPSFIRRWQSFSRPAPRRSGQAARPIQRFGVASIRIENEFNDVDYREPQALLAAVTDESRLSTSQGSGSLTAAGGWCAPSERVYDLCGPLFTNDETVDVPEIQVRRGGLEFSKGIDWAALTAGDLATVGGTQTEAEAIAGEEKECIEIPCPTFTDERLDAEYICTTIPLLTEAGWPELVREYVSGMVALHEIKLARKDLTDMLAIAGAAVTIGDLWPNALSLLHALELVILGERQRYNMAASASLEVVLPTWVRGLIRADLANRNGVESYNVTDAQIRAFFATRGARVQFVKRFSAGQDLVLTPGVATDYPATVEALIYPAGTFVRGRADVKRLDAVYSPESLQVNTYTGMFVEQGRFLINRCYTPRRISLAAPPTGRTAAADIVQVLGSAPVGP